MWRRLPAEEPPTLQKMLRDKNNDIVREELDPTPFRSVALLLLPVNVVPCVGQVRQVVLPADKEHHAAISHSVDRHSGFLGCAVHVKKAQVLPRGCVGAEVQDIARPCNSQLLVTLRGVTCLRIIDRGAMPAEGRFPVTLVQEVLEWTALEEASGEAQVLEELQSLVRLFQACGELQERTGIWAAGDLRSKTLDELTDGALAAVHDVQLSGAPAVGPRRRAVLAAHAAVMALKDGKRSSFLCDPCSVLRRLRGLTQFLALMQGVLGSRVPR